MEKATFGAGCFWGPEEAFRALPGVLDTQVGYMGSRLAAEVVEVSFDPAKISYADLLKVYWSIHDPTQLDRQGPDIGPEYRSVIFAHSAEQRQEAERSKAELEEKGVHQKPVLTAIEDAADMLRAAEFHQRYYEKKASENPQHD